MGKRLEFLKEAFPAISRVALLSHLGNPGHDQYAREASAAARTLGIQLQVLAVRNPADFEDAFSSAQGADAILQIDDAMFTSHREKLVKLEACRSKQWNRSASARSICDSISTLAGKHRPGI